MKKTKCKTPGCNEPEYWRYDKERKKTRKMLAGLCQHCHSLKRRYNITLPEKLKMIEDQENKCVICDTTLDQSACLDHCHKRNVIRAVLCNRCNSAIGWFEDDADLLSKASLYLTFYPMEDSIIGKEPRSILKNNEDNK